MAAVPALFEGAGELVALCCLIICIGMLMATAYTFDKVAGVLDVRISFGFVSVRPFHRIATLIRNTVIHWCEAGVSHLEHGLTDLLHGFAFLWHEQWKSLRWLAHAIEDSFSHLRRHELPGLWHAVTRLVESGAGAIATRVADLAAELRADVTTLRREITAEGSHAIAAAESYAGGLFHSLQRQFDDRLGALETTIEAQIGAVPGEIAAAEQTVLGRLHAAETAIAGELGTLEDTLRTVNERLQTEIDKLADEVGTAGLAGILTGLLAIVAEAGLDGAECRGKVRQICATDPGLWSRLLGDLAVLGFGLSLAELTRLCRPLVGGLSGAERALS